MNFDFNSGGNNSANYNNDRVSERDRLEIGADGRTREETNQSQNHNHNPRRPVPSSSPKRPSNWKYWLGGGAVVGLIIIGSLGGGGGFSDIFRTFNSTPEENMGSMLTAVKQVEHENKKVGEEKDPVYDKQNIFSDEYIDKQVDKEYAVYVYTGEESTDKPFNKWVLEAEKIIPVYRVKLENVKTNVIAMDYLEAEKPMVIIYNEVDKGKKELDAVIKDKDLLKNIVPHIEKLQEKKGVNTSKKEKTEK